MVNHNLKERNMLMFKKDSQGSENKNITFSILVWVLGKYFEELLIPMNIKYFHLLSYLFILINKC